MSKAGQILSKWVFLEDVIEFKVKDNTEIIDSIKSHKLLSVKKRTGNIYSIRQRSWYASPIILSLLFGEVVIKIIDHESKVLIKSKPSKYMTINTIFLTTVFFITTLIFVLEAHNITYIIGPYLLLFLIWFVFTKVTISLNKLVVDKILSSLNYRCRNEF